MDLSSIPPRAGSNFVGRRGWVWSGYSGTEYNIDLSPLVAWETLSLQVSGGAVLWRTRAYLTHTRNPHLALMGGRGPWAVTLPLAFPLAFRGPVPGWLLYGLCLPGLGLPFSTIGSWQLLQGSAGETSEPNTLISLGQTPSFPSPRGL